MPIILAWAAIIGVIVTVVVLAKQRSARPELRMRREFKRLRSHLLGGVDDEAKPDAERVMDEAARYLDSLLSAAVQRDALRELQRASREMLGISATSEDASQRLGVMLEAHLEAFFVKLARVSAVVAFPESSVSAALEDFTETIETQRDAMRALTDELGAFDQKLALANQDDLAHHASPNPLPNTAENEAS